eukprot:3938416-Rhodomonas_salina.1
MAVCVQRVGKEEEGEGGGGERNGTEGGGGEGGGETLDPNPGFRYKQRILQYDYYTSAVISLPRPQTLDP